MKVDLVGPSVYSKNMPNFMFVAVIFIPLLITLNCTCCLMLYSIQFALQSFYKNYSQAHNYGIHTVFTGMQSRIQTLITGIPHDGREYGINTCIHRNEYSQNGTMKFIS